MAKMTAPQTRLCSAYWSSVFARDMPRSRVLHHQSPLTARLRQQPQTPWQLRNRTYASYGRFNYQRFQSTSGLLRRWANRPTFYYEVGGIGVACGGFYAWNLEEVPVSRSSAFRHDACVEAVRSPIVVGSISSHRLMRSKVESSCTNK